MKHHRYRVTLEYIATPDGQQPEQPPLTFEACSHDEIIGIVQLACQRGLLNEPDTTALVVGQKLFGEVLLQNRSNPLFTGFWPHFVAFMKGFKGQVKP